MAESSGVFVISLDFELHWGVRDLCSVEEYKENLLGAREAIPQLLKIFSDHGIHATFATVGFLFAKNRTELQTSLPAVVPQYVNPAFSPYGDISQIGEDESADPFHFASSVIERIQSTPGIEIGSHTFAHYYCSEAGHSLGAFRSDLQAAAELAEKRGTGLRSLVFPRNQYDEAVLIETAKAGFWAFRGNEDHWNYRPRRFHQRLSLARLLRFLDAYVNVTGSNCYSLEAAAQSWPLNLRSSRFLRPYTPRLRGLESLRLRRITRAMTVAAGEGLVYHLWWHPHNYGTFTSENFRFLRQILRCFERLRTQYRFRSLNMSELAGELMGRLELSPPMKNEQE